MNEIIYETPRLLVRKWSTTDADDLYEYCSDPDVTKYLIFPTYKNRTDAEERITAVTAAYAIFEGGHRAESIDFAIEHKIHKKVIGSIGFVAYSGKAGGIIEVGYLLNRKYHGSGYMTEALSGMFNFIVAEKLAKRIEAKHDSENKASGKVMQRAGMTFEGIRRKAGEYNNNNRSDLHCYSILAEEVKELGKL